MDFNLRSALKASSLETKVLSMKFAAQLGLCALLCEKIKQEENLSVHQDGGRPCIGIPEI
jgi:hypothetical protein